MALKRGGGRRRRCLMLLDCTSREIFNNKNWGRSSGVFLSAHTCFSSYKRRVTVLL